jgi:hypothetical protein
MAKPTSKQQNHSWVVYHIRLLAHGFTSTLIADLIGDGLAR